MDMMVRCLVAQFRLNHRNTHTFNICINSDSPPSFKLAFLQALFVLLKEVSVCLSLSLSYLYLTPSFSLSLCLFPPSLSLSVSLFPPFSLSLHFPSIETDHVMVARFLCSVCIRYTAEGYLPS